MRSNFWLLLPILDEVAKVGQHRRSDLERAGRVWLRDGGGGLLSRPDGVERESLTSLGSWRIVPSDESIEALLNRWLLAPLARRYDRGEIGPRRAALSEGGDAIDGEVLVAELLIAGKFCCVPGPAEADVACLVGNNVETAVVVLKDPKVTYALPWRSKCALRDSGRGG